MAKQKAHPLIELRAVSKRYADKAVLQAVDLTVAPGEVVALLGHNGAGKTTMMKLILGLTRPSDGTVRVAGVDPGDPAAIAQRGSLGYLPENVAFRGAMTGRELLRFYARLKRQPLGDCDGLLERVGLAEAADRKVRTYSKGMRQRLGLAQALLGTPDLLLLDEPTSGLDPHLRQAFYDIVGELRAAGVTTLISSHALSEIEARSDRLAIMKQGKLVACGALPDLRQAADLPVRMKVSVAKGQASTLASALDGSARLLKVNDSTVDLACLGSDKMAMVRRIAELEQPVLDLDIQPPDLEDLYAHYVGREEPR